jgi:hypothetical protein
MAWPARLPYKETAMPQGDKSSQTDNQKRQKTAASKPAARTPAEVTPEGKKVPRRSRASELSSKRSAAAKKGWATRREKKASKPKK